GAVGGLRADRPVGHGLNQRADAATRQFVVVDEHDVEPPRRAGLPREHDERSLPAPIVRPLEPATVRRRPYRPSWRLPGVAADAGMTAKPKAPDTWDNLVRVSSKKLDLVYLQPGADFRGYSKVIIDPTEVAFRKDWARDYNRDIRGVSRRVSEKDVRTAIDR